MDDSKAQFPSKSKYYEEVIGESTPNALIHTIFCVISRYNLDQYDTQSYIS